MFSSEIVVTRLPLILMLAPLFISIPFALTIMFVSDWKTMSKHKSY